MVTLSVDDQHAVRDLMKKMLTKLDPHGNHMTARNMDEAIDLMSDDVQIVFLDIEMPGMNGIEGAEFLQKRYKNLNIVFITGHIEYSFSAHGVFPSGFLAKPFDEQDIIRVLGHLRFPIEKHDTILTVRCHPFALFVGDKVLDFTSDLTTEIFAYLVYKEGAFVTNGELLAIMWEGNIEKSGRLRQLIMDMRSSLAEVGAEHIMIKKYGKIGLDMRFLTIDGNTDDIKEYYNWY